MKKVLIALGVVVVVVGIGAYLLFANLGAVLKAAIEKVGSDATQASVKVERIDLSASSGEGKIVGLNIGNPKGFKTAQAFSLGEVGLKLDVGSLKSDVITIKEIAIAAPKITYEHASGGSNLETLKANVQRFAESHGAGGGAKAPAEKKDKAEGKEKKLIIERLVVRDGEVAVSHAALQGKALSAKLPAIELRDIGKSKGGATPAEVADEIIGKISDAANKAAVADLEKTVGRVVETVRGAVQGARDAAGNVLRGVLGGGQQQQQQKQ